jgi:hypothetical protein
MTTAPAPAPLAQVSLDDKVTRASGRVPLSGSPLSGFEMELMASLQSGESRPAAA